jgi:hypothetical protein
MGITLYLKAKSNVFRGSDFSILPHSTYTMDVKAR